MTIERDVAAACHVNVVSGSEESTSVSICGSKLSINGNANYFSITLTLELRVGRPLTCRASVKVKRRQLIELCELCIAAEQHFK